MRPDFPGGLKAGSLRVNQMAPRNIRWLAWCSLRLPLPIILATPSLIILAIGLTFCWHYWIDDAYISFRYARNLAEGHGLVWNAGERVEGFSNPLWVLLLAAGAGLGGSIEGWASFLTVTMTVSVLVLSTLLLPALGWCRKELKLRALLPILLVLTPGFLVYSSVRMETMLFCALLTALLLAQCRQPTDFVAPTALCLAIVLTRPEGLLYVGAFAFAKVINQRLKMTRDFALWAVLTGLGSFGIFALRLSYFGSWFPNTYYAKIQSNVAHEVTAIYVVDWLKAHGSVLTLALLTLSLYRNHDKPAFRYAFSLVSSSFAFACYAGGDWMPAYRLIVPVLPIVYAVLVLEAAHWVEAMREKAHAAFPARWQRAGLGAGSLLLCAHLFYSHPYRQLLDERTQARMSGSVMMNYREAVEELGRLPDRPASIAIGDAGFIPYHFDAQYIDLAGLNDPLIRTRAVDPLLRLLEARPQAVVVIGGAVNWMQILGEHEFRSRYSRVTKHVWTLAHGESRSETAGEDRMR